ncbi:stage V sporulation protein AA, partial [Paenibacillus sp. MCAF20]
MEANKPSLLYLRLKKRIYMRPEQHVTLGQAARLLAADAETEQSLKQLILYEHKKADGNRVVIDLLQIVKAIREAAPGLSVEAYGDPQVLVMIAEKPVKPRIFVLILSWLLLFFGAGLAIMNFHTDVSMKEVHTRIVELISGKQIEHPLWFQIPYSLGIG